MHTGFSSTPKTPVTLVLIADGKQALFYECRSASKFVPVSGSGRGQGRHQTEVTAPELTFLADKTLNVEPLDQFKIPPDQHGSKFGSVPSFHHTNTPHPDIADELKLRFMRTVADALKQSSTGKAFDQLVIAAPAHLLGALKAHLDPMVQKLVAAEIAEDLTHCKLHELLEHIKRVLPKTDFT